MEVKKQTTQQVCTISVEGRLDTANSGILQKAIDEWAAEDPVDLVLDFENLIYITSSGLRCLIMARRTAAKNGRSIRVVNARQAVKEVFEITGLSSLVGIL